MSNCQNFNSNTQAEVELSGTLQPGDCWVNPSQFFGLLLQRIHAKLPGNYSTFLISDIEPAPQDRDKAWVAVDPETCRPLGIRLYVDGLWIDIGASVFYGEDSSLVDNVLLVDGTSPAINFQVTGHIFIVKAGRNNTGETTITIRNGTDVYVSEEVRKFGNQTLSGFEYLSGQILMLVWDGAHFQLLNPRPDSFDAAAANLSFERDVNGDNIPDQWDLFADGDVYNSGGGDTLTAPNGGSGTTDTTGGADGKHGSFSFRFDCTSGFANGGGFIQNSNLFECDAGEPVEISWWTKSEFANVDNRVEILFYTGKLASTWTSTIPVWRNNLSNPVGAWRQHGGLARAPVDAKYFRIRLVAGATGTIAGGKVWFDDVRLSAPNFTHSLSYARPGLNKWLCPPGVHQVRARAIGAGAGGGAGETSPAEAPGGGGGGGGTYVDYQVTTPGEIYEINVGAGGDKGTTSVQPTAGGDTTVDIENLITGEGGDNGFNGAADGGDGGVGGTGTIAGRTSGMAIDGERGGGEHGEEQRGHDPGVGGNSSLGAGGASVAGANAQDGAGLGGGGGGARGHSSPSVAYSGGEGAPGGAIIEY